MESSLVKKKNKDFKSLVANHLSKSFKKKKVVDDVSFEIFQGEIVGLLGPNGAGKTTSFYMAVGLITPDSGEVLFDSKNITKMSMYLRSREGVGYLPQEASVFRKMTVEDNIKCVLEIMGYNFAKRKEISEQLMEDFSLTHVRTQMGFSLSGGERRRVEIARALATNPKILLLDEPFAGVDPIAVREIQVIIKKLQSMNIGVLITDHNVRETLRIVSRAYIMASGKVLIKGTTKEIVSDPEAKRLYLGSDFKL